MSKNTIIAQRKKLRGEIKALISQYQCIKQNQSRFRTLGPFKEEKAFQLLNSIAMRYAKDGFIQFAESWLLKAEPLTLKNPKQAIIMHNNMACILKNQGNLEKALEQLKESETILKRIRSKLNYNGKFDKLLIDCWLNLSAIYSSQKNHEKALYVIEKTQELLLQNLKVEHQKFVEQYIITKYNKSVELENLGKIEQAYACCDETRKMMNEKRVYGHFLEKKINELHQDLRKKVFGQNKHQRSESLATSLHKLKESKEQQQQKEKVHSRKMSSLLPKSHTNKLQALLQAKENWNLSSHRPPKITKQQETNFTSRKPTISQIRISPMMEITNKKMTIA